MEQTFFKIALVNTSGGSNKFWKASIGNESLKDGYRPSYLAEYGKIGTRGTPNSQAKGSHIENWKFLKKKIQEKLKKGYIFDVRNTSKHFIIPETFFDGQKFTEKQIMETKRLARDVGSFCANRFDFSITPIYKGEGEIREATEEDIKPRQKPTTGLKDMLSRRKKEAKFEF